MTASLVYELACDRCGARYARSLRFAGSTRHSAREDGWTSRLEQDGREKRCVDFCGDCTAKGKR